MTNQDKKEIQKLIRNLPEMQDKDAKESVTISGHELLRRGIKEVQGSKVVADKRYLTTRNKRVNHKTEAEGYFKKFGIAGVREYVNGIIKKATA